MIKLSELVPGTCRFISRRRLNIPSYRESMERALNMLFPEGVPQPNGVPQRPPFPFGRRWRYQRKRWNNYERQFLTNSNKIKLVPGQMRKSQWMRSNDPSFLKNQEKALNLLFPEGLPQRMQPPPRPPFGQLWHKIKLVPGQMRKSQYARLNEPLYLKAEQALLNHLFPEGLPAPVQPPPPRPQADRFLWPRSRRGEIATRSCKYRFPVRAQMKRIDF